MSATTWRSLAAYCSRVSNQGFFVVVAVNFWRIQDTAVSCNSTSAQHPGCALASWPQNNARPPPPSAAAMSGVTKPVTVLKTNTPTVKEKLGRSGSSGLESHRQAFLHRHDKSGCACWLLTGKYAPSGASTVTHRSQSRGVCRRPRGADKPHSGQIPRPLLRVFPMEIHGRAPKGPGR